MAAMLKSLGGVAKQSMCRKSVAQQVRCLNLHEYQSLDVFSSFGVQVPRGGVAKTVEEAVEVAKQFPGGVVVKSQVLAGGRGLGTFKNGFKGGVHICDSVEDVREKAGKMLNQVLVTKQTGEAGKPCDTLFLCEKFSIKRERYFAILMDRGVGGPIMIGSKVGGTSIEDIAEADPTAIIKMPVDIMKGLSSEQAREMAVKMDFHGDQIEAAANNIAMMYKTFIECDCTMVEINPLGELDDGRVIVCDAKVGFDDNAAFRQKDIHAKRDFSQEDSREVEASKWDLNYIGLDGDIACMVNGAGLAMATMDVLKLHGGEPANFLDVGGAAQKDQIKAAFDLLQGDPKVKSIFINIFGGIMRCDVIAEGVVGAIKETGLKKPVVVRLVGTNVERGQKILEESGLDLTFNADFTTAAKKAVEMAA